MTTNETREAVKRLIDYECNSLRYWIRQCNRHETKNKEIYQSNYNTLVCVRERITEEYLAQFLDRTKFDMPEAVERIFFTPKLDEEMNKEKE